MFTGIIENLGQIREVSHHETNQTFWVESPLSSSLKVDQSLSHDGVCLTVEEIKGNLHRVTAIKETLNKTSLGKWKPGTKVNLERSLTLASRLDGHFVQGHVDSTGICIDIANKEGSYEFEFSFPENFASLVIEKGSICINGVSLTAWDVKKTSLKVAIIPYTYQNTNFQQLRLDDVVNLEFDLIGKYIVRKLNL
jgi:riboflavin synthase